MNTPIETRELVLFLSVAEELHFRRAAERLRIAQPYLTTRIRRLEERLGLRLLDRTTRSVRLTPAGEKFYERAKYAISQIEDAVATTKLVAEGRAGRLNIGFTPAAAFNVLPRLLRDLRKAHPSLAVSLSYKETAPQIRELVEGRLHFGFLRLPVHTRRLNTLVLAREGVVAALPIDHRLSARTPLRLEDLAGETFIQYQPILGVDFQEHVVSYCNRAGFSPRAAQEVSDTPSAIAMVAAGFGVAILPGWVQQASHPSVVFRGLPEIPPVVDLAIAWLAEAPSPAMQSFLDVVDGFLCAQQVRASARA